MQKFCKYLRIFLCIGIADRFNGCILLIELFSIDDLWIAYDDTTGIEVVVECLAFAKELRREEQVEMLTFQFWFQLKQLGIFLIKRPCITNRNSALDNHNGIRVHLQHQVYYILNMMSIEEILDRIVVGGSSYDNKVRILIGCFPVKGCGQFQILFRKVFFDILILYR